MDEINENVDRIVDLINLLKSRYFLLRAKYDLEKNSLTNSTSTDIQTKCQYVSSDLQSFTVLLHLVEYACSNGLFSLNLYVTRQQTNLTENINDPHFLKILKSKIRDLIETNNEIKNLSIDLDSYELFQSYLNSFSIHANILKNLCIPHTISQEKTDSKKKKDKMMKKISKINFMSNIMLFLVNDITDYGTEETRAALNKVLKYRTPRTLNYYTNKLE